MDTRVYISKLKDDQFDYDVENPDGDNQYAPEPISPWLRIDKLYRDIVQDVLDHKENAKKTDWGTFVVKLTNADLVKYLSSNYYKQSIDSPRVNELHNFAKALPDGEYLLVAQELS
jgi:hypothetical protein